MTGRDRMVVVVLGALAILAVAWMLVVSPERKRAKQVQSKVETASAELSAARGKLAEAQKAQRSYAAAYASIVSLGEAVPANTEVPSLVYELDHASGHDHVSFESITSGGAGSSASAPSAAPASVGGFQQLPFTFSFVGTYEQLYKLIGRLQGFTVSDADGSVHVNGRLLGIQGLQLQGGGSGGEASGTTSSTGSQLKATVTATAYVLPPSQTLTGGASASAPSGAGSTTAASSGSSSSTAAPAVVRPLP